MAAPNPIREALAAGEFRYIVEIVASASAPEEKIFQIGSDLITVPGVIGAGITSYAGGSAGHDPIRIGEGIKGRGLTPNVHITCVNKDQRNDPATARTSEPTRNRERFRHHGRLSGGSRHGQPPAFRGGFRATGRDDFGDARGWYAVPDLRRNLAVQIHRGRLRLSVSEARKENRGGRGFRHHAARLRFAQVSRAQAIPRRTRSEDSRFRQRLCAQRGRGAKKFSKGRASWLLGFARTSRSRSGRIESGRQRPRCTPRKSRAHSGRPARARAMRALTSAARTTRRISAWSSSAPKQIAPQWEEFAEEISYGPKGGFFFFDKTPRPKEPKPMLAQVLDVAAALFPVKHEDNLMHRSLTSVMKWIDQRPAAAHALEQFELAIKEPMFGCQACGNCVLGEMEYVCPMTCPKNLRNGPCGGTFNGMCEVIPDKPCIWVKVYETAKAGDRVDGLETLHSAARSVAQGHQLVYQSFPRTRRPPASAKTFQKRSRQDPSREKVTNIRCLTK